MSTETTGRPPAAAPPTEFTDAEHQLLDAMNVPANRLGRGLLFREMQRTGLDPFAKHLYLREDWNKSANRNVYSVASTIDGFRIVAARQPTYEGQTAPQWCDKNGNWSESWWVDAPPVAARIGVYVRGYREPMWGIARFNEYKPGGNGGFMWTKMPALMIAKVAEALAIRKAYPDQLSGVYTDDEMQQADARKDEQAEGGGSKGQQRPPRADDEWNTPATEPTVTGEQLGEIARLLKVKRGATNGDRNVIIGQLVRRPVENVQKLSQAEAASIIATLTAEPDPAVPDAPAESGPPPGPAPVGTPENPSVTDRQQRMMHSLLNQGGYGDREKGLGLISRIIGRTVESSKQLSKAEAGAVITALTTGEIPPATASETAPPADAPTPPAEGFTEFDALDQMIWDVASDEARAELEQSITVEVGRGTITASDAGILRERLAAHVQREKAGAAS